MEKSIESIWKTGFVDDNAYSIPKVTDFYNRKSNDIIERIIRMFKLNVWALYIFGVAFLAYSIFTKAPVLPGVLICLLFIAAGWYTRRHVTHMKALDKNVSSYEYLKNFRAWLSEQLRVNVGLARVFYPTCVLAAMSIVGFTDGSEGMVQVFMEHFPNHLMVSTLPLAFLLFIIGFPLLFVVFAKPIYYFDVRLVYGRIFKKLDNIIADLEELRT